MSTSLRTTLTWLLILYVLVSVPLLSISLPVIYFQRVMIRLTSQIHPGMTKTEVLAAAGKPKFTFTAGEQDKAYSGFYPKPRIKARGDLWVYEVMWTIRLVVYFDEHDMVRCTDAVRT